MAISLLEIRTQARNRADMSNSDFVDDSELNFYINQSIKELHDILTDAYQSDYYMNSYEFSTVSGTDSYALPSDFYELRGVDIKINQDAWHTVKKYNFNERVRYKSGDTWSYTDSSFVRYRLVGPEIRFMPAPDRSNLSVRLWYTPKAVELVDDTDTFEDYNGYIEYVIVDAAIKMMQKEESDVSILANQKAYLQDRIRNKAMQRDADQADSVQDIYAENDDTYWGSSS